MSTVIKSESETHTIDSLRELARMASESKNYANITESQLFNLMLSARDLGISPMKAINGGFYIVNGKVCMSTALMADRIRKNGHSIKVTELTWNKCIIIAIRKDNGDSLKFEYTMEDAKLAGLNNSLTWKKYPKSMLYNRCMSQIARILFPDVVGNSYSEEERFDIQNIPPEERPLEEAEAEMVLVAAEPVVEETPTLSVHQKRLLNKLIDRLNDQEAIAKLEVWAGCTALEEMHPSKFDKVIAALDRKLQEGQNDEHAI